MDVLYIVIPAYNEEANIEETVRGWYPVVERCAGGGKSRLVVVNDGSRDRTGEILADLQKEFPMLVALTKENSGHGPAVLFGYRYALEHGADYVFQTDSDGQTLPSEFHKFWERREKYDFLNGWRRHREDGRGRVVVTRTLRLVIRLLMRVNVPDANTPFRLMKSKGLRENLAFLPPDFQLPNAALSAIYKRRKQKICYMEITFRPRQGGVNSINPKRVALYGMRAIKDFSKIDKELRRKGF